MARIILEEGNGILPKIKIAKDLEAAKRMDAEKAPAVTVGCEYDGEVVLGLLHAMIHHTEGWSKKIAPALSRNILTFEYDEDDYMMISHIDLDVICGIMGSIGKYDYSEDIKTGVHYLNGRYDEHLFDECVTEETINFVYGYIGYVSTNAIPAEEDVTDYVYTLIDNFTKEEYIELGKELIRYKRLASSAKTNDTK